MHKRKDTQYEQKNTQCQCQCQCQCQWSRKKIWMKNLLVFGCQIVMSRNCPKVMMDEIGKTNCVFKSNVTSHICKCHWSEAKKMGSYFRIPELSELWLIAQSMRSACYLFRHWNNGGFLATSDRWNCNRQNKLFLHSKCFERHPQT